MIKIKYKTGKLWGAQNIYILFLQSYIFGERREKKTREPTNIFLNILLGYIIYKNTPASQPTTIKGLL